ncbi:hypothetical protein GQ54DRAFT_314213, partial [Martensiomyces pterosporus]
HIFTKVLGPQGLLKTRARILVTNAVQYLPNVDAISMLRDGEIIEQGTFSQVMDNKGAIFNFVHKYIESGPSSQPDSGESRGGSDTEYYEDEPTTNEQDGTLMPPGVGIRRKSTKQTLGRASIGTIHEALSRKKNGGSPGSPSDQAAESGRTMTTETSRQGKVEWDIYMTYFRACGLRSVAMFGAAMLAASLSNVSANMWLKHWASSNTSTESDSSMVAPEQRHSVLYYLLIYGALGLLGASMSALQSLVLWT